MIFLSTDGDEIGQKVGRASLADDVELLHSTGEKIQAGNALIAQFAESQGGQVISSGGDELNITVPEFDLDAIETLRKDYQFIVGATLTVGVGSKLSEANKALHVAKIRGKNQTLMFSPEVDQEWLKNQEDVNNGNASGEAKKIGEAYMSTQENKPSDNCPACAEYDNKELKHDENCPLCKEYDDAQKTDLMSDDCPACKDYDNKELSHNEGCSLCQEYDNKQENEDNGKDPQNEVADAVSGENDMDNCPECQALFSQASENSPEENADESPAEQGMETKDQILDQIDQAPGSTAQTPEQLAQNIDDTEMPQGQASDGNKSVPENFGEAQENTETQQPGQEGQVEQGDEQDNSDSPDMVQVLKDGLEENEDEIKRQKVVDMVSRTLLSFKSQKDVLEQTKDQFPDFYMANIQMLRCMIELCKLLGLEPKREQSEYEQPAQEAPAQPPEQSAAPQEGADQSPQS